MKKKLTLILDADDLKVLDKLKQKTGENTNKKAFMKAAQIVINDVPKLQMELRHILKKIECYETEN